MPRITKDPIGQIEEGNPWYTDDQFAVQLGTPNGKFVVENRWRIFSKAITLWIKRNQADRRRNSLHILDAGCGDGINLFGLSQVFKRHSWDAKLFGIDYNPFRLSRARCITGVHGLQQASLQALPFLDDCFDVILCNHVLEHIADDKLALIELRRILNEGGLLILGVPNEGCFLARLRNRIIQPSIMRKTDHLNFYTGKTLELLLNDAGFDILHIEREGFFTPHLKLHSMILQSTIGRAMLNILRRLFPLQCAELFVLCT